jgi:hypothetical protein
VRLLSFVLARSVAKSNRDFTIMFEDEDIVNAFQKVLTEYCKYGRLQALFIEPQALREFATTTPKVKPKNTSA